MTVLAVTFRHTIADIHVTSFPPRRQSLLKILTLLGSNRTVAWMRITLRDLKHEIREGNRLKFFLLMFIYVASA